MNRSASWTWVQSLTLFLTTYKSISIFTFWSSLPQNSCGLSSFLNIWTMVIHWKAVFYGHIWHLLLDFGCTLPAKLDPVSVYLFPPELINKLREKLHKFEVLYHNKFMALNLSLEFRSLCNLIISFEFLNCHHSSQALYPVHHLCSQSLIWYCS